MIQDQDTITKATHDSSDGTPVRALVTRTMTRGVGPEDREMEDTPPQHQSQKRTKSNLLGAPTYPSPKERADSVDHQHYVRDTMQDFNTVPQEIHPTIVNSHDIPISRRGFTSMTGGQFLNDDIINWTLSWWCSQIGGGQNENKIITPQVHPSLPRCYYTNTQWFTKLQDEGTTAGF
jgi:Ulp1 family protease